MQRCIDVRNNTIQGVFTMRIAALLATMIVLSTATVSIARQRNVGGHVVHTRRAPVVLHRAVPPFKGVHVYEGRQR
jgi:hypothetical protein